MKIFTSSQIRDLDKYTIESENISSLDLMERAAEVLFNRIRTMSGSDQPYVVFAGPGNNGGDGLAVARMLRKNGYNVKAYLFNVKGSLSPDCLANRDRLVKKYEDVLVEVRQEFDPPQLTSNTIVIDALFGSGINKPLTGGFAAVVKYINQSGAKVVSIDMPSGLMTEENTYNVRANIIKADVTLTLGMKKLCMMFADNQVNLGRVEVLDIGLSEEYIANAVTRFSVVEEHHVEKMLRERSDFAHKGSMGHALLVAGSYGMAGAAVLSAKACLRSGVGKVTVHTPRRNNDILQISIPEAIIHHDIDENIVTQPVESSAYNAIGIGPGMGTDEHTAVVVMTQLRSAEKIPAVVDADALNILANHRSWYMQLPEGLIFTPHPKEMDRLSDTPAIDDYDRLMKACELAQRLHAYVLLKGHYSALCMPDGQVVFNSSGNSGMATAGSGDVLTGIITALLARGYSRRDAAIVGMFLHGKAGDFAAVAYGKESMVAGDIIDCLPDAFKR